MSKELLLIGGGHAHMVTLANLEQFIAKGYGVTVIQPSIYHYYSGMGPGMLGGTYRPEEIRFATKELVESKGANFVEAKAYSIDPDKQVVTIENSDTVFPYDVLSCNAGSFIAGEFMHSEGSNVFSAKPIEKLKQAKETVLELVQKKVIHLAVLGSGPSSVEIAGNLHQLCKENTTYPPVIQLFGGSSFMAGRPARVSEACRRILLKKGVEIIEKGRVTEVVGEQITLENGETYRADLIFPATGVKPSEIFSRSTLATGPDGGLLVNNKLQSTSHPNVFGGGDCIYFQDQPLDKVGVYAVRQNHILFRNLMAALENSSLQQFSPGGSYLLIYNLGDGQGVLSKWSLTFSGRLAFTIKDHIDRKFISSFQ